MTQEARYEILLVGADDAGRAALERIFEKNYAVRTAEDGAEAITLLRQTATDVILLYAVLPDAGSFELIHTVRADEALRDTPIVVAATQRGEYERTAFSLGADDFIAAPFDAVVLEKRVSNIVQKYILERERIQRLLRDHELRTAALKRKAEEDDLTDVNNRKGFWRLTEEILSQKPRNSALMIVDVDEFKTVNDRYGHPAGDELLKRLARYFENATLPEDVVGRIGGDEFAVYLRNVGSRQNAMKKANMFVRQAARIRRKMGLLENRSISVGIAYAESPEHDLETLYQIADHALYLAKENGKGCAAMLERQSTDGGGHLDIKCSPALYPSEAKPAIAEASALETAPGAILVLDRHASSRALLRQLLQGEYRVYEAASGELALGMLPGLRPHVQLVVIRLYDTDVDEGIFLRWLARDEAFSDVPVIAITGDLSKQDEMKLLSLGAVGVLKNEERPDVLLQCVQLVMRKRMQELYRRKLLTFEEQRGQYQILSDMDVFRFEWRQSDDTVFLDPSYEDYLWGDWSKFRFDDPSAIYIYTYRPDYSRLEEFLKHGCAEGHAVTEVRLMAASGMFEWFRLRIARIKYPADDELRTVLTFVNMDKEIMARAQLEKLSRSVMLTQIPNLNYFITETGRLLSDHPDEEFAMVQMDVERFHLVNQLFGMAEGDNVLRYIAVKLQEYVESNVMGTYAHLASDRFCACIGTADENVSALMAHMQRSLDNYPLRFAITMAFGVYPVTEKSVSVSEMLNRASAARATVKGNYARHFACYGPELRAKDELESAIVLEMQSSLKSGRFLLYLQPRCDIKTRAIVGAEALARWDHPVRGIIEPETFIPIFEHNGFVAEVDKYMIESVCRLIQSWHARGIAVTPISVNLSRTDIYDPTLLDDILAITKKYGVQPHELEFEITEGAFITDDMVLSRIAQALRAQHFTVSMDDFGSGYSSLNSIKDINVDIMKIDLKLLHAIESDNRSREVIRAIALMARALEMEVVAEGVETAEQEEFLLGLGLRFAQGFYYHHPMPVEAYEALLPDPA